MEKYLPTTELHTHMYEILDTKEFLDFLKRFDIKYPINKDGYIDFSSNFYCDYNDIINSEILYSRFNDSISFNKGRVYTFNELEKRISNRADLLDLCASSLFDNGLFDEYRTARAYVIYLLMKDNIASLLKQGIKYSEISFSNFRLLSLMKPFIDSDTFLSSEDIGIDYRILMGTLRSKDIKDFRQNAKGLSSIIGSDMICGFDLLGEEEPICMDKDIEKKLSLITSVLDGSNKICTLRLHSGESGCKNNTIELLRVLDKLIKSELEIRIGHGFNINMDDSLYKLLKRFNAIIELNITSNISLGYVKERDIYKRLLDYYIDHDIEVVLSTDGNGLFGTTLESEYETFESIVGDRIDYIKKCDLNVYNRKLKR